MQFSVIVPVYNVEQYLPECLDSLFHQTYGDWEAVCVDDGSTDGCAAILAGYASRDSRIKVITQPNGGLSAARNTGLDNATGDYILFLDSDDWLEPNTLECIHSNLRPPTSDLRPLDLLCFGGWMGSKAECPTSETFATGWNYYNRHALEHHEFPFVCVVLRCYRRQLLTDNRLTFRHGILHEDNLFTPQVCLAAQKTEVIPAMLYHYRVRPGSIMTTRGIKSRESLITISNELSEKFGNIDGLDRTTVYRFLTQCYQMAFLGATDDEASHLRTLVDWTSYRRVSRTKFRHRINFATQFLRRIHHKRTL
jgi:glycosyltransferase involved in cell wall biosynthesis